MNAFAPLDHPPEKLLKAVDVANTLNISRAFAYQLMLRGEITTIKIGTARRVRMADLKAYILKHVSPTNGQST